MSRPLKSFHEAFPEVPYVYEQLHPGEFLKENEPSLKERFIRHCMQGSMAKYLGNHYNTQPGAIATHYGTEKNGTLYQYYDEDYWGFHTGMGALYDVKAFGNEQANEAWLKLVNGRYYWMAGNQWKEYTGPVFTATEPFQGHIHWAAYTPEQIDTGAKLIAYLCYNHGIPLEFENRIDYLGSHAPLTGILNHSNISTQRSDPGPAYPYKQENELVEKYFYQLCNKHGFPIYAKKPK